MAIVVQLKKLSRVRVSELMSKTGINTGTIFEQLFDPVLPVQGYRILTKDEYAPFLAPTISGGKHLPDRAIETPDWRWLILSKKWQEL